MKEKIIIFLMVMVCMLIPCRTKAQQSTGASGDLGMYSVGKQWLIRHVDMDYDNNRAVTERYGYRTIVGDTVINDVHAYLELESPDRPDMENLPAERDYTRICAEIDGAVCFYMEAYDEFIPEICFDVVPGQEVPYRDETGFIEEDTYCVIKDVGFFDVHGIRRKVIHVPSNGSQYIGLWVEGIGNINGVSLIMECLPTGGMGVFTLSSDIIECTQDGEVLFDEEDMACLVAQVGVPEISSDSRYDAESAPRYYNLQGQPVAAPRSGDLLIRVTGDRRDKVIFGR